MLSDDLLEMLWMRLQHSPAEPGVDRWEAVMGGDRDAVDMELRGPLSFDLETAWRSMPAMHALRDKFEEEHPVSSVVDKIFDFQEGLDVSRQGRWKEKLYEENWSYSEVDSTWLFSLFGKLKRIHGHFQIPNSGTFVDCGSGSGRNVFVAALAHSWQRCVGIEAVSALHERAQYLLKERYREVTKENKKLDEIVEFVQEDFLSRDAFYVIATATLIYCDLTCCNPAQLEIFRALADDVTQGTVVVTLTRPLVSDNFFLLWQDPEAQTSWGKAAAFVYERKPSQQHTEEENGHEDQVLHDDNATER